MTAKPTARPRPPSVERVLAEVRLRLETQVLDADETGSLTTIVRDVVAEERDRLAAGEPARSVDGLAEAANAILEALTGTTSAPVTVINATGVVLHTNLGRAPWPEVAILAARAAAESYGFLELEPETGRRGRRFHLAEDHLVALTGADGALVVNNNAAAVALVVGLAGPGGQVVVSRGELVEIGGGVRIPEIIERAGAVLVEVGTTNRTRAADFEGPLARGAKVVLRVHPSNFTMSGFIEEPEAPAVAELAHRHDAIVIDDLGSGALLETERFGLHHEPMPRERLAAGADVVTFSGDKLVGGPQAGLIVGRADLIERLRRDPLARAMRPDKAIVSGVAATLGLYRAGVAINEIPIWTKIARPADELKERAEWIASMCAAFFAPEQRVAVVSLRSTVGGGSLPGQTLPSWGISVAFGDPDAVATALRVGEPPILARIVDDAIVFDLRTAELGADGTIVRRIGEIAQTSA